MNREELDLISSIVESTYKNKDSKSINKEAENDSTGN